MYSRYRLRQSARQSILTPRSAPRTPDKVAFMDGTFHPVGARLRRVYGEQRVVPLPGRADGGDVHVRGRW